MFYVIGAGGVGTFLAKRLSEFTQITLLRMRDIPDHSATPSIPPGSILFVTTKAFQLRQAIQKTQTLLKEGPASVDWFFLQNGLGIDEEVQEMLPLQSCHRILCWFGVRRMVETGDVHLSGMGGVDIACRKRDLLNSVQGILEQASIPIRHSKVANSNQIANLEWQKAWLNLAINGVCGLADIPNGGILENPGLKKVAEMILGEACKVASKEGISVPKDLMKTVESAIIETSANFNSTLQDLRAGRPTEMPWLNGAIVKKAKKLGLSVPVNESVSALIEFRAGEIMKD